MKTAQITNFLNEMLSTDSPLSKRLGMCMSAPFLSLAAMLVAGLFFALGGTMFGLAVLSIPLTIVILPCCWPCFIMANYGSNRSDEEDLFCCTYDSCRAGKGAMHGGAKRCEAGGALIFSAITCKPFYQDCNNANVESDIDIVIREDISTDKAKTRPAAA